MSDLYQVEYRKPYEEETSLSKHMTYAECVEYAKVLRSKGYIDVSIG